MSRSGLLKRKTVFYGIHGGTIMYPNEDEERHAFFASKGEWKAAGFTQDFWLFHTMGMDGIDEIKN